MKTDSLFYRLSHSLPQLLFDLIDGAAKMMIGQFFTAMAAEIKS